MAELPEVLVVTEQMNHVLIGKKVTQAKARDCSKLIRQGFVNVEEAVLEQSLTGRVVVSVQSRGKWIILEFDHDKFLLLALEMGGKTIYLQAETANSENYHLKLEFEGNMVFIVRISGLGFMRLADSSNLETMLYPGNFGFSPVDKENFTLNYLTSLCNQYPNKNIKDLLINQQNIAGIANGYTNDIFFVARIHPKKKARELSEEEQLRLYQAIKQVMQEAVEQGGREGEFDLYNKEGRYKRLMSSKTKDTPCPVCGSQITAISTSGSTSYICSNCQK